MFEVLSTIASILSSGGLGFLKGEGNGLVGNLFDAFVGGKDGTELIDRATSLYSKLMLAPLMGLANMSGDYNGFSWDSLTNNQSAIKLDLPSYAGFREQDLGWRGFEPGERILGDPGYYGSSGGGISVKSNPMTFNVTINMNGSSNASDARMVASVLSDHLQSEVKSKLMRES
jgi:hypothetical protein